MYCSALEPSEVMPITGRGSVGRAARSGLGNGTLLARPAGPDGGAGGLRQRGCGTAGSGHTGRRPTAA
jgi:hypothetical protein